MKETWPLQGLAMLPILPDAAHASHGHNGAIDLSVMCGSGGQIGCATTEAQCRAYEVSTSSAHRIHCSVGLMTTSCGVCNVNECKWPMWSARRTSGMPLSIVVNWPERAETDDNGS